MTCPSHESFPLRFLWAHKIDDLALHTVVGLVLQEADTQKFPEVLSLQKPGSFCMGLPASSMSHRHREWCDDKKFVQFELAKLMVLHRQILFNLAVAKIVDATLTPFLQYHSKIILSTVSIGGRIITNLRFADDIDGLARQEEELANLVERLDKPPQPTAWRSVPKRPS